MTVARTTKVVRLSLGLTAEQHIRIKLAAKLQGVSVSAFVLAAAIAKAQEVLATTAQINA